MVLYRAQVHNVHPMPITEISEYSPGNLSAFNVSDGELVWSAVTPRPPNNAPAIGHVKNLPGLSVVMPLCQQVRPGSTCDVEVSGLQWDTLESSS